MSEVGPGFWSRVRGRGQALGCGYSCGYVRAKEGAVKKASKRHAYIFHVICRILQAVYNHHIYFKKMLKRILIHFSLNGCIFRFLFLFWQYVLLKQFDGFKREVICFIPVPIPVLRFLFCFVSRLQNHELGCVVDVNYLHTGESSLTGLFYRSNGWRSGW